MATDLVAPLAPAPKLELVTRGGKRVVQMPDAETGLDLPESAMYGFAATQARAMQAPLGWAYCTLLTLYAGRGVKAEYDFAEPIPPRLYTCLFGNFGDGKSRVASRARIMMGATDETDPHYQRCYINSNRALDTLFPAEEDSTYIPSCCVYQDEMTQMMNMVRIQNSSLPCLLNDLYYGHRVMNATRAKAVEIAVKLSLLGCLKCADPDEFHSLWTAGTASGMYDRFIFVPGPEKWIWDQEWRPQRLKIENTALDCSGVQFTKEPLQFTVHVKAASLGDITAWDIERRNAGIPNSRCAEIAKRVAIISAAINADNEITPDCAGAALEFAKWQARVRCINEVSQAETLEGMITSAVLKAFALMDEKTPGAYCTWRSMKQRHNNWIKRWGAVVVDRVFRTLSDDELEMEPWPVDADGIEQRPKACRFRIAKGDPEDE